MKDIKFNCKKLEIKYNGTIITDFNFEGDTLDVIDFRSDISKLKKIFENFKEVKVTFFGILKLYFFLKKIEKLKKKKK